MFYGKRGIDLGMSGRIASLVSSNLGAGLGLVYGMRRSPRRHRNSVAWEHFFSIGPLSAYFGSHK